MKKMKWIPIILTMAVMFIMTACNAGVSSGGNDSVKTNPQVMIEMESGAKIVLALYPDMAPNTVNNFISLVNKGYYDGVIFHRVIEGFMIQGGDPQGTGTGGPGYMINGEFPNNDFPQNTLKHERGVISMARQGSQTNPKSRYNTAGSQFFIMHENSNFLDGDYAAFGRVISGMEEVDRIASVKTDADDKPITDEVMKKVTVELFGVTYPEPETIAE